MQLELFHLPEIWLCSGVSRFSRDSVLAAGCAGLVQSLCLLVVSVHGQDGVKARVRGTSGVNGTMEVAGLTVNTVTMVKVALHTNMVVP